MQGARVLARALAAAGRQHGNVRMPKLGSRQGEFAGILGGFAAQEGRASGLRGFVGKAGVGSFASSSLFSKVWSWFVWFCDLIFVWRSF